MNTLFKWFWVSCFVICINGRSEAAIRPEKVYLAESKKTPIYVHDGLFVGGDRAIQDVIIKDIRRAANPGFERLVIDLEKNQSGEAVALPRTPYYQVAVSPEEKRLVFTVWGKPNLKFDSKKVKMQFRRSRAVDHLELLPRLEEEMWTFVVGLKTGGESVQVFELSNPVRIIVDIRVGGVTK